MHGRLGGLEVVPGGFYILREDFSYVVSFFVSVFEPLKGFPFVVVVVNGGDVCMDVVRDCK